MAVAGAPGTGNAQIADRLPIAESTVQRHLTKLCAQLDGMSTVDVGTKARAAVLVPPVDAVWQGTAPRNR